MPIKSGYIAHGSGDRILGKSILERLFWLIPLTFYLLTASPTPGWVDAPLIARTVHTLDFHIWVNNHNLFTLVGAAWTQLFPDSLGFHRTLNLLCAFLGALTVHVVFLTGLRLTANWFAAALGAIALMVSHSLWWHSTMLEVYTLSTLLLALVLHLVLRYEQTQKLGSLLGATLCFGLACANHVQMGLLLFGFVGLLGRAKARSVLLTPRTLVLVGFFFLLGFQVYVWVFVSELLERLGRSGTESILSVLTAMVHETTGGGFRRYMFPQGLSLSERGFWWSFYAGFFVYNFPSPALVFGIIGASAWLRTGKHRTTLAFFSLAFLAQFVWSSNYFVWDMYAFALPVYTLFAVLVALGIDWVFCQGGGRRAFTYLLAPTLLLPIVLYHQAPRWIRANDAAIGVLETLPQYGQATAFWDPLSYFFDPNKRGYDRVERYSQSALSQLEPSACYWGDEAKLLYPLNFYYQDVLERRQDVRYELIFAMLGGERQFQHHALEMIRQLGGQCPVYVSSLGYPERDVLNYVYAFLDRKTSPARVANLTEARFVETFPLYEFDPIELDPSDGVRIFRMSARTGREWRGP